jgi:hypothetical protein
VSAKTDTAFTDIKVNEVEGYFVTQRSNEPRALILDELGFNKYFHVAKTMTNVPTKIDFNTKKVGAVILPETDFRTTIVINSISLSGKTLVVDYSVNRDKEKQSFTIIPSKAFTLDSDLAVDVVIFKNGNNTVDVAFQKKRIEII